MLKHELSLLSLAIASYTRIPMPPVKDYTTEMMAESYRYFPLVGTIVGALTAALFVGLSLLLPTLPSVWLALGFMLLITGAMHEDGWADLCDGMGGGYTRERRLEIMKDSRIGAFGVIGLLVIVGYRAVCWDECSTQLWLILPAAQTYSRLWPVLLIRTSRYARTEASKSDYSRLPIPGVSILVATLWGVFPLCFFPLLFSGLLLLTSLIGLRIYRRWLHQRIGGFTGDCLGALQVGGELLFYTLWMLTDTL